MIASREAKSSQSSSFACILEKRLIHCISSNHYQAEPRDMVMLPKQLDLPFALS